MVDSRMGSSGCLENLFVFSSELSVEARART